MNHDLIERYLYAATRRLPAKNRQDVAEELRSLIQDMLDERCGEMPPTDKDLRVVLTELGTPNELYAQYSPGGKKCLIGPPHYSMYQFVLKIVLLCVAGGISLATLISLLTQPLPIWYEGLFNWLGTLFGGLCSAFAFVTLLFAFFYHRDIQLDFTRNLDDLPPIPKPQKGLSRGEAVFGIIFTVVFLVVFLWFPSIFSVVIAGGSQVIPIFNQAYIASSWPLILLFGILGIAQEIVKLIDGRYTLRVMISSLATNLLSAVLAFLWLANGQLLNPRIFTFIELEVKVSPSSNEFLSFFFTHMPQILLALILFSVLLDSILTIYRTLREKAE